MPLCVIKPSDNDKPSDTVMGVPQHDVDWTEFDVIS